MDEWPKIASRLYIYLASINVVSFWENIKNSLEDIL